MNFPCRDREGVLIRKDLRRLPHGRGSKTHKLGVARFPTDPDSPEASAYTVNAGFHCRLREVVPSCVADVV